MNAIPTSSGVYRIICSANGKTYVGSAVNLRVRWRRHRATLTAGGHANRHLQNAWDKYGAASFRFEIAEFVPRECLLECEQRHLDACGDRFNIRLEARSNRGVKASPETRAKMSAAKLGKAVSVETRAKLSAVLSGKTVRPETRAKLRAARLGKVTSEETRAKLRGHTVSAETREKLRAASLGRKHSMESRAKMSGKTRSAETRAKIGAAHRGLLRSDASRAKMSASAALKWERIRATGFSGETSAKLRAAATRQWATKREAAAAGAAS